MSGGESRQFSQDNHPANYDQKLKTAHKVLDDAGGWMLFTLSKPGEEGKTIGNAFFAHQPSY